MDIAYSRHAPGLKEWLRLQIKAYGNLKELRRLTGLSESYLTKLRAGNRDGAISESVLTRLEDALGVKFQPSQE